MYEQFYGIERKPFSLTPDPRFLMLTKAHCEVKAALTYSVLTGKGFTVLTGDAGTGKTTLVRAIINSVPNLCFSCLVNPVVTPDEFYEAILADFGLTAGPTKPERLRKLLEFLIQCRSEGCAPVLFVDEAHRLSIEMLEEIRLLTNFETEDAKLLHIVLVGQDELDELIERRELRQLKQRIEVRQHIGHLAMNEVPHYIEHRWKCAGGAGVPFSAAAMRLIAATSGGIPRLINSICDNALLLGFAEGAAIVGEQHVAEAARDLRLSGGPNGRGRAKPALERTDARQAFAGQVGRPEHLDLRLPAPATHSFGDDSLSTFAPPQRKRSWLRFWRMKPAWEKIP